MPDERQTFECSGSIITANYNEQLAEGRAWCPICGQKRISASADGEIQVAMVAAKNQIVAHLRLNHRIQDNREQQLSEIPATMLSLSATVSTYRSREMFHS